MRVANRNLKPVTVRQRIDQLAAEPPVRDLGYAADQRLVAGALLGLQLLADEIDALKAGATESLGPRPFAEAVAEPVEAPAEAGDIAKRNTERGDTADMVAQLAELTGQIKKLTKAIERSAGKQKKRSKQ